MILTSFGPKLTSFKPPNQVKKALYSSTEMVLVEPESQDQNCFASQGNYSAGADPAAVPP